MQITIAAIGKIKNCPEDDIIAKYRKRLPWNLDIKEVEEKKALSGRKLKDAEGKLLLAAIPEKSYKIALDERGKLLTSIEFAKKIDNLALGGISNISFIIGGADGHGGELLAKCDMKLSLGKFTLPHMLARAVFVEQLYRAYTINSGHPYHRE